MTDFYKKTIFLLLLFTAACGREKELKNLLKYVDELQVVRYTASDTISVFTSNTSTIARFKELINGKDSEIKPGIPAGWVNFNCAGETVLTASFTTSGCVYAFRADTFHTEISYAVGEFLVGR